MQYRILILIASHFWKDTFKSKAIYPIMLITYLLVFFAAQSGWQNNRTQNEIRAKYQQKARESWEANPDKHPHRMAHFGTFAFRLQHPLSMLDFGIESFTGTAVFLEAHKQNTVNFSEASFSTGLLRFGELSMAMILQTILPLVIFFLGFATVVTERENGTLKITFIQGAGWKEILLGKSLGLMAVVQLFFIPVLLVTLFFLLLSDTPLNADILIRFIAVFTAYFIFFAILCFITIGISATSRKSKNALVKLLGIWLIFVVLMPKTSQALGSYFHPSPSKIKFKSEIEDELVRKGDSHNPDDPYFMSLKDSILNEYDVESVTDLPFNYGGFVMSIGEKNSSEIYNKHFSQLLDIYRSQNLVSRFGALINPYIAIKNVSMALAGTNFVSYTDFQTQAESYRYNLAQKMNELQMEYISPNKTDGSEGKTHVIGQEHWEEFPDFEYSFLSIGSVLKSEALSILSLFGWILLTVGFIINLTKTAKVL